MNLKYIQSIRFLLQIHRRTVHLSLFRAIYTNYIHPDIFHPKTCKTYICVKSCNFKLNKLKFKKKLKIYFPYIHKKFAWKVSGKANRNCV